VFISNAYAQTAGAADPGLMGSLTTFAADHHHVRGHVFPDDPSAAEAPEGKKSMMDALAKGDEVVTAGGILGRVTKVNDAYVTIEVAAGTEIVVQKNAVTTLLPKGTLKSL
jgi:preprotein translocase subunit YajC